MKKLAAVLLAVFVAVPLMAQDAEFYFNRGVENFNAGNLDFAIADWTEAIKLKPDYVSAWYNRGLAYHYKGELDRAIADYTQAIALNPKDAEAYYNRGIAYRNKGEHDRAIADYTQAIALNPKYDIAYYNRGIAYYNKGELDRAIADYTQAIALNPENDRAYNGRGVAYVAKGELDRAIADYTQAIALNPKFDIAYNNRGNAYRNKGELDRAIADYTQAITLNPKYERAYTNRGIAYAAKGELDKAIADYTQAIALNPKYADAYNSRGIAYAAKGELDSAITDYTQAIALNSKFDIAYNNRGVAYAAKGELDSAIADYTRAIALNPKLGAAYSNRGNAYREKGEFDKAIVDITQAALAADASANILDIFHFSWELAGFLYKTYPFLGTALDANAYRRQYADVAREALALSIAKAEKARAELGSRGAALMAGMVYQYYASLDFEARFGSSERSFAVSEGLRSRGFLEQMGTEAALRLPGIAQADARRVRELTETIGNLQELLGKLNPQADEARYAQAGLALTRAEEELAALDKSIAEKVPRYADLRSPKTAALGEAQAFCGEDTAILEFALWDASVEFTPPATSTSQSSYKDRPSINSYCLVITKDGITPVRLDPDFDYAAAVNELRSLLIKRAPISQMESLRNSLYVALVKPLLPYIPRQIKNLMIVPDGTLGH
ncbi:MAG: tetratricopeptide repeat protein, partial [Spirochaetaceae bacterium]|nr:tetratricopeptide repeat protein [Spirochaetaceae bacterium]